MASTSMLCFCLEWQLVLRKTWPAAKVLHERRRSCCIAGTTPVSTTFAQSPIFTRDRSCLLLDNTCKARPCLAKAPKNSDRIPKNQQPNPNSRKKPENPSQISEITLKSGSNLEIGDTENPEMSGFQICARVAPICARVAPICARVADPISARIGPSCPD